jgi:hypothetical protein
MITVFLGASFGMMALLSVPLTGVIPQIGKILGPPFVEDRPAARPEAPDLPPSSEEVPRLTESTPAGEILLFAQVNRVGPASRPPEQGPAEEPSPPEEPHKPKAKFVFLHRLAQEIRDRAGPRLKALIRSGKVEKKEVLAHVAKMVIEWEKPGKQPSSTVRPHHRSRHRNLHTAILHRGILHSR